MARRAFSRLLNRLWPGRSFSPRDLPGLQLWLDASRITGLVDGDPVATWSDLSGNGNHATQATGSKRPTYKVAIINGRPVVRFDGVDDWMGFSSLGLTSFTIAMVINFKGAGAATYFVPLSIGNSRGIVSGGASNASKYGILVADTNTKGSNVTVIDSLNRVIVAKNNAGTSTIARNGVDITGNVSGEPGWNSSTGVIASDTTGANPIQADYGAIIAYNRALAADEELKLTRYLGARSGVSVA